MSSRPAYFEPIRQRASERWKQLEQDPELAGPWHQLFKQVQSPRHILSELLQNADDANATETAVSVENGPFVFKHNGEDFSEEHFASLCRFGYSNKRALHTIGFRGIGFKSTFSLGGYVELSTPTLSVAFEQDRFTEPKWVGNHCSSDELTSISVPISDEHRRKEVAKNLDFWKSSPVSLLFFRKIRKLQVDDTELHWGSFGVGPVERTEWLALHDNEEETFLIARSEPEEFPAEALEEIKQERLLGVDEEAQFPPCSVEIVLGAKGRLYVVLPTGVKTNLPFASNAPFIQDPVRLKIKDPETSPTNRWLLQRVGRLAATVMLKWLSQSGSDPIERAKAYDLMPDVDHDDNSLEGVCATIVEKEFAKVIEGKEFLLTDEGDMVLSKQSIIIPDEIIDVWSSSQATAFLDDEERPVLSRHVSIKNRKKLLNWDEIEEINAEDVLNALQGKHLPKPRSWSHLLGLWSYLAPAITGYHFYGREKSLCIVPVQGKEVLCAADEVVRLGEKKMLPSTDDWQFLGDRLSVLDQKWLRYLTSQRREAETNEDKKISERVEAAYAVLEAITLNEPSDTGKVINQVATDFFAQNTVTLVDAIRIAQISAKLGATVDQSFRFVTQDRILRPINKTILFDEDGTLDLLLPEEWSETHILNPDYMKSFTSCTREEWLRWVSSGRSKLYTFVPFSGTRIRFMTRIKADKELKRRGFQGRFEPRYKNPWIHIDDFDFEETIWNHWENIAEEDAAIWGKVAEKILMEPNRFWSEQLSAIVTEEASNGRTSRIIRNELAPSWVLKLREKDCLRDTHGIYKKPEEVLRRTPDTEALMDIEPFIHALFDNESSRPLLKLLGVGDIPTGPDKLLNLLRALAASDNPPAHEVEKWYRRLDQMMDTCSTEDYFAIKSAFRSGKLILTENGTWEYTAGVFLASDEEDAPDADVIRASVKELTLWRKIGVADRPTAELAIKWLQGLPSGQALSQDDARRVRSLLKRHAERIWAECEHWLNLAGEWVKTDDLGFALTLQPQIPWAHYLHKWVKQKTADFRQLPLDKSTAYPFSEIPLLAEHVDDRFHQSPMFDHKPENRLWLKQLGIELCRVSLDKDEETERVRSLGRDLSISSWQTTTGLEIISYIDGTPAGTPRRTDAVWLDKILYAEDRPLAKLARVVSQELDRSFRRPDIADAIKLCFDRPTEFVTDYMEENFTLIPRKQVEKQENDKENEEIAASGPENIDKNSNEENVDIGTGGITGDGNSNDIDHECEEDGVPDSENIDEQVSDIDDGETPDLVLKPQPKPRQTKPSVMERFALKQGFKKDADSRYFHEDGRSIVKVNGSSFPWELRSKSGDIICHYWPKEHCLERDPLEIESDIWGLLEKHSDRYSMVLLNPEGKPIEMSGKYLHELSEEQTITLHPAKYRIVYNND